MRYALMHGSNEECFPIPPNMMPPSFYAANKTGDTTADPAVDSKAEELSSDPEQADTPESLAQK